MSPTQWSWSPHLTQLASQPQSYELIQAVRLIYQEMAQGASHIRVRYRASLSLAFPLAEIESMQVTTQHSMGNKAYHIDIYPSVIGLTGPLAALPSLYTDYLASRVTHGKDNTAPAFLDLFNHRLTDLYVQSSWFYNLPLQYELSTKQDRYLLCLRALARQPTEVTSIDSLIAYAGMIAPGRLTAEQLAHVLSNFFDIKISVEQFVPEWFTLPKTQQTAIGTQNAELGVSSFCGARVVQFDSKIRIICHELSSRQYLRLLPQADMYQVIVDFVRKWCGVVLAVEVQLELHKDSIKPLSFSESEFGALGRGGFLLSQSAQHHHADTRYLLPSSY